METHCCLARRLEEEQRALSNDALSSVLRPNSQMGQLLGRNLDLEDLCVSNPIIQYHTIYAIKRLNAMAWLGALDKLSLIQPLRFGRSLS